MAARPSPRNRPRRREAPSTGRSLGTSGGARQEDAASADINNIAAQYRTNRTLPIVPREDPLYGDFTGPQDLQDQIMAVQAAEERFGLLPAAVREAAAHNMPQFLAMLEDEDGREILQAAGLEIVDPDDPRLPENASPSPAEGAPAPDPVAEGDTAGDEGAAGA